MKFNRHLGGLFAFATLIVASGCGGSGSTVPSFSTGDLNFSGAEPTADTSTSAIVVPATGGTTITTTGGVTAVVPSGVVAAGTTLPAGTEFAIIPAGVGFPGALPSASQLGINSTTDTGATIGTNGLLTVNVALPVTVGTGGTNYAISFPDAALSTDRTLTIHKVVFSGKFYIHTSPLRVISPVPTSLSGKIPNNGQNAAGSNVNCTFGSGNDGRGTHLLVDYGTGFTLKQTQSVANLKAKFTDLTFDSQNVPQTGVQLVQFNVSDL